MHHFYLSSRLRKILAGLTVILLNNLASWGQGSPPTIGQHTVIGRSAVVGPGAIIGDNVRVKGRAQIASGTSIGNNSIVKRNASVGRNTNSRFPLYFFNMKSGQFYKDHACLQPVTGPLRGRLHETKVVRVVNINPLYQLKATATPLTIDYGTPTGYPFAPLKAAVPGAPLAPPPPPKPTDIKARINRARDYHAALQEVGNLARQIVINDSIAVRKALEAHQSKLWPTSAPLPAASQIRADFLDLSYKLHRDSVYVSTELVRLRSLAAPSVNEKKLLGDLREIEPALNEIYRLELAPLLTRPDFNELPEYWVVMQDSRNFYQTDNRSRPILLEGDRVQVELTVVKRPEFEKLPAPGLQSTTFFIHVVGTISLDVSAGLVFNGLRDYEYALRDSLAIVRDTTVSIQRFKRIQENKPNFKFKPGLATLLNVRYKVSPGFSTGLSGGATLVADNKSILQYHLGLSALLGDRQRVVVTAGWSWGYVKRLADGYAVNEKVPYSWSNVPTKQEYQGSFMVGVTYNLSSLLKPLYTTAPAEDVKEAEKE